MAKKRNETMTSSIFAILLFLVIPFLISQPTIPFLLDVFSHFVSQQIKPFLDFDMNKSYHEVKLEHRSY